MELCKNLIRWLQSFQQISRPIKSEDDLIDGVILAQILRIISPYFSKSCISRINADFTSDKRLQVSNLKKIIRAITDFFRDVVKHELSDVLIPDVNKIVEYKDLTELSRLLQLVLGCATKCDNKREYIRYITTMDESVQRVVMLSLQEIFSSEPTPSDNLGSEQNKSLQEKVETILSQKVLLDRKCSELESQLESVTEDKLKLISEVKNLTERLRLAENLDDPNTSCGRRYQLVVRQVEEYKEELFKLETARNQLMSKCERQEKEIFDMHQKSENLKDVSSELSQLRDENDILRQSAAKVTRYEVMIEAFKKKQDDYDDMKLHMEFLEKEVSQYMSRNSSLEEEVKRSSNCRQQLDELRHALQEARSSVVEERGRADKSEIENKRLQDKISILQRDKDRLVEERNLLKDMTEELKCSSLRKSPVTIQDLHNAQPATPSVQLMNLPAEIREQVFRLQHENKKLKMQASSKTDDPLIHSKLEEAESRNSNLEVEIRNLNYRILELESHKEDVDELRGKVASEESNANSLKRKLAKDSQAVRRQAEEIQQLKQCTAEMEKNIQMKNDEVNNLKSVIEKLEAERRLIESKLVHVGNANKLFQGFRAELKNTESSEALKKDPLLPKLLEDRDRCIRDLEVCYFLHASKEGKKAEKRLNEEVSIHEKEERLMASAWYNLSKDLHKTVMTSRLSCGTREQDFISSKRRLTLPTQYSSSSNSSNNADVTFTQGLSSR